MALRNFLDRFVVVRPRQALKPIPPGLYHYQRQADGAYTRFHLRVEPDEHGLLLANASVAARLSPVGVRIAKALLEGKNEDSLVRELAANFRGASEAVMRADIARIRALVDDLASPEDNYPILNLDDAAVAYRPTRLIAPLSADVTLAAGTPPERLAALVERLWAAGIPHVVFVIPEKPDAALLIRAVERAGDTGMISGVRGRGIDLNSGTLMPDLARAGLDHVDAYYASARPAAHEDLFGAGDWEAARGVFKRAQELEICPVAQVPLVEPTLRGDATLQGDGTLPDLPETLADLHSQLVTNISFFAIAAPDDMPVERRAGALTASALPQAAVQVEDAAHAAKVRYVWQPPVLRDPSQTLSQQARQGPRASGDVSVRVEPDGAVIPPRGPRRPAGNLLSDTWESIWSHPAFRRYRERVEAPTRCDICPGLAICAADCPRELAGWSQDLVEGEAK
jgi:radical SAM protein with 4Fe4S-binding SPASM domain